MEMEIQSGHSELSVTGISQVSAIEGCLLSGVPLYAYTGQHVGNFIMCAHIIYSDVNECISSSHNCGTGICFNTPGSYTCDDICPPGYFFNTDIQQCDTVGKNYYLAFNFVVITASHKCGEKASHIANTFPLVCGYCVHSFPRACTISLASQGMSLGYLRVWSPSLHLYVGNFCLCKISRIRHSHVQKKFRGFNFRVFSP